MDKKTVIHKGPKLSKKQLEIFDSITNSNAKFHIINASRQSGKSFILTMLLLHFSFNLGINKNILVVNPTHQQNLVIYDKVVRGSKKVILKSNRTEKIITFRNGTTVVFKSAEVYENIRGATYNYALIDEFSYMKQVEVFNEAIRPTTATFEDSKICIFSTPRGKNYFYTLFNMYRENDKYKSYQLYYYDNPYYDLKEVEDARLCMPEKIFKSEYLAEFLDDAIVFNNVNDLAVLGETSDTIDNWAGIDIGKENDFTVITIINSKYEVKQVLRKNKCSYDELLNFIRLNLTRFFVKKCYIEINFEGMIYDTLKKEFYNKIEEFRTTHESKNYIIQNLMLLFDKKEIKLLKETICPEMINELKMFDCTFNKNTGSIIYGARQGFHDDCVISLALAVKAVKDFKHIEGGIRASSTKMNPQIKFEVGR